MKTLGRVLIILIVFALVMGITYTAVNAASSSLSRNGPTFERRDEGFPRPEGERREGGGEGRGGFWIFGFIRNVGIVAIVVAVITVPRALKRRKTIPENINER